MRIILLAWIFLFLSPALQAQPATVPVRVVITTLGPGDEPWEKFGHNMLDIHDPLRSLDLSVNWGLFDFDQPGFIPNFILGHMMYWCDAFQPGVQKGGVLQLYEQQNRLIRQQELPLSTSQYQSLLTNLNNNLQPENKQYHYDYFRDNCSTRLRDMVNDALGGKLRKDLEAMPTFPPVTYRDYIRRMMRENVFLELGMDFCAGPATDRPLNAWEDSFIPTRLSSYLENYTTELAPPWISKRAPLPADVPDYTFYFGVTGMVLGGCVAFAGRNLAWTVLSIWWIVAGIGGLLLVFMWLVTDHWATYRNENMLMYSPVFLLMLLGVILQRKWSRLQGYVLFIAIVILLTSCMVLIGKSTPWFVQQNSQMIALALPMNVAAVYRLWQGTRIEMSEEGIQ